MNQNTSGSRSRFMRLATDGTPEDIIDRYARLAQLAETWSFGTLDRGIVVLDTETTGLSYTHDGLIQVAAARYECGKAAEWFVSFVNPGKAIPEEIEHLTHISNEDIKDAPGPNEVLAELVEFVGDARLVAHNASFDRAFTTKYPAGYPLLQSLWLDSLDLARIALPRMKSHRLIDLVKAFDAPLSTHRADADVEATCALLPILYAAICSMPYDLVERIGTLASAEEWPTGVVFAELSADPPEGTPLRAHRDRIEEAARERERQMQRDAADRAGSADPACHAAPRFQASAQPEDSARPAAVDAALAAGALELSDNPDDTPVRVESASKVADDVASSEAHGSASADVAPLVSAKDVIAAATAAVRAQLQRAPAGASAAPGAVQTALFPAESPQRRIFSLRALRRRRTEPLMRRRSLRPAATALIDDARPSLVVPPSQEIEDAFSAQGLLGAIYPAFEPRGEQVQMAQAVRRSLEVSENLVVEAGTGVGKSMAYLVPAALTAVRSQATIGVATNTNALLDQLVYSELPALATALAATDPQAPPLSWAPLKGLTHYPCLRKIDRLAYDGPGTREVAGEERNQAPALATLLSYVEQSAFDDMDGLKLDFRLLPRWEITTTSQDCLKRKCSYFGSMCFGHGARRYAETCNVVVTNHALLCCDLSADGGLLPEARAWVVDEAHGFEAEARRAFTSSIESASVLRVASRVSNAGSTRNVLTRLASRMKQASPETAGTFHALLGKATAAGEVFSQAAGAYAAQVKGLLFFDDRKANRSYETTELWLNSHVRASSPFGELAISARALGESAAKLSRQLQNLVAFIDDVPAAAEPQREMAAMVYDLDALADTVRLVFDDAPSSYVYQADLHRKKDRLTDAVRAVPLEVGHRLNEALYARADAVVYASATLSVAGTFDAFSRAAGLGGPEGAPAETLQVDSSYDFDRNMTVYVVSDMPEPASSSYLPALKKLLVGVHRAQRGSMLTLFTNRREMESCFDDVQPQLKRDDLRLVCQKWGVSAKGLRDEFIADESLSLFALKSFWQGFDAPGSTLRGVVIPKLPFARPTDPLSCERGARDDRAWFHYVLPQAVIELKQAAGRLIRRADDAGVVILADRRLVTKAYGRTVLASMPSKTVRICTAAEVIRAIEAQQDAER
ncbi:helicase C-terminal domain-containing protein [Berryella wangjianweii]|nr:helicase C-terminal domain-containing protein [Berryella wangjianweii]